MNNRRTAPARPDSFYPGAVPPCSRARGVGTPRPHNGAALFEPRATSYRIVFV